MFMSREIDFVKINNKKTGNNVQQLRNQSENDYISQQPENLRFAPVIIILFLFLSLILLYSPYCSYYVTITSANGSILVI